MTQIGFYHDMTRCVGCKTCQVACKDKNNLEIGTNYRHSESYEVGAFPAPATYCYTFSCNHCAIPACFAVCPVQAIAKMDDGTVIIDEELCIGCQDCIAACPYGVPVYKPETNTVGKCDGCYEIRQNGGEVSCASGCAARALYFGELEELQSRYGAGKTLSNDFPALGASPQTEPSILVNLKEAAKDSSFMPSLF